jgi:uncharacterized protein DUF1707
VQIHRGYDEGVALVSAREREAAASALRRHFVSGRLSAGELADRVQLALEAREGSQLRRALRELPPPWRDGDELRRLARVARRRAVIAAVTTLWVAATLVLLIAFAAGAVAHGATAADAVGYPLAWLVVTALAAHACHRA